MIIELEMLQAKLTHIPGFPDELKVLLEHLIISHHGQYEFGSPKLPMFPEALMLHYLDDLDSKMESMRAQFERESELETAWTGYNPSLARPLLNTLKFLEKAATTPAADEPADLAEDAAPDLFSTGMSARPVPRTQERNHLRRHSMLCRRNSPRTKSHRPASKAASRHRPAIQMAAYARFLAL